MWGKKPHEKKRTKKKTIKGDQRKLRNPRCSRWGWPGGGPGKGNSQKCEKHGPPGKHLLALEVRKKKRGGNLRRDGKFAGGGD